MTIKTQRLAFEEPKPEMNFVPFIDVMLVLLIIFMATTPSITSNIHIDVPKVSTGSTSSPDEVRPNTIIVSIDSKANLYLSVPKLGLVDEQKDQREVSSFVSAVLREDASTKVYLRSDATLAYQTVADVMNLLKQSGVPSINLVTIGEKQ